MLKKGILYLKNANWHLAQTSFLVRTLLFLKTTQYNKFKLENGNIPHLNIVVCITPKSGKPICSQNQALCFTDLYCVFTATLLVLPYQLTKMPLTNFYCKSFTCIESVFLFFVMTVALQLVTTCYKFQTLWMQYISTTWSLIEALWGLHPTSRCSLAKMSNHIFLV